jgi:hypothetical protein
MNKLRKAFYKNGTIRKIVFPDGSRRFWQPDGEEISFLSQSKIVYDKWLLRKKHIDEKRLAGAPIMSQARYRPPGVYIGVDPASNDRAFGRFDGVDSFSTTDHNISAIDAQIGVPVAVDLDTGLFIRARVADRMIGSIVGIEWNHRAGNPDVMVLRIQTIGA